MSAPSLPPVYQRCVPTGGGRRGLQETGRPDSRVRSALDEICSREVRERERTTTKVRGARGSKFIGDEHGG